MALSAVPAALAGCMGGLGSSEAVQAEMAGEFHRAYDLYCRSAAIDRNNRMLGMAIARVAPHAASHWETEAHRAVDRGEYAEAWRLFMRVLEIRPDHPSAPYLIRRLERDHALAVAPARTAWLRRGSGPRGWRGARLAKGYRPGSSRVSRPAAGADSALPKPVGGGGSRSAKAAETKSGSSRRVASVRAGNRSVAAVPATRPKVIGDARGRAKPGLRLASTSDGRVEKGRAPAARRADRLSSGAVGRSRREGDGRSRFQFLVVRTLSKKDRRFPKKVEVIDGLVIELRDTDDDPDADFNVYLGGKRIGKYKGIRIGEQCRVVGRSGRLYEVVLLSIIDRRRTIRFGIRPARPGGTR